jgi:peroxiredoxin
VLIGVSLDRMENEKLKRFVKTHEIRYPVALDSEYEAAQKYGVRGTPMSFLIDGNRRMVGMAQGPRPWDSDAAKRLIRSHLR